MQDISIIKKTGGFSLGLVPYLMTYTLFELKFDWYQKYSELDFYTKITRQRDEDGLIARWKRQIKRQFWKTSLPHFTETSWIVFVVLGSTSMFTAIG